jgi:hypothetical protein
MATTGVHRRTIVALISIGTAISCVSMYLQLSFIVLHVNSIVSEAKLQFATVPDQLPLEIQQLKVEASTSQAIEIEKTRQEVEQAVTTKTEKSFEEHLADLREKHREEMEQLRTHGNDESSVPGKPVAQQNRRERARILVGIFSADLQGEIRYRKRFRDLFRLHPRVCSLADFTTAYDSLNATSFSLPSCEIIYTFVAGGNPNGPAELVDDSLPMLARRPVASKHSADLNDSDMTHLNIRYVL